MCNDLIISFCFNISNLIDEYTKRYALEGFLFNLMNSANSFYIFVIHLLLFFVHILNVFVNMVTVIFVSFQSDIE